ncbi:MAG: hypothetical protein JWP83_3974 [Mycobacterium sp.]|jgi:hypothetical protein|nr:hypothetical protein [Mycobacterium sp.]
MDEENDVSELARWVRVQRATAVTLADQPRGGGGPPRLIRRGLIVAVDKVRNADPPANSLLRKRQSRAGLFPGWRTAPERVR